MTKVKSDKAPDLWFSGDGDLGPNGGVSYFICSFLMDKYPDPASGKYIRFCTNKQAEITESDCSMSCPYYGSCNNCSGFSALRCQACDTPRP